MATLTWLDTGVMGLIAPDEIPGHRLEIELREAFRSGKSKAVTQDGREAFLNIYLPAPRLIVIGAVHITQALAVLAPVCGFALSVIDPRSGFATAERFAGVDLVVEWPDDAFTSRPLDPFTAVAAVSHDPGIDDPALIAALEAGCFYVGALGSRRSHERRLERLQAAGLSAEMLGRIRAPIGLDIAASTPQEIAVSILAQIIAALRRPGGDNASRARVQPGGRGDACLVEG
ncbi:XdhC family protein [Xaviernesmea oryzae]|uniref:XdhC family protein n=1 Tax=Xaviernesmea oryzae TaxID=464029 RepID=UPI00389AB108